MKKPKLINDKLTHEQKVRLTLWQINVSIIQGVGIIIGFFLILITVITTPPKYDIIFLIISVIGYWAIFITILYCSYRNKKQITEVVKFWEEQNKKLK